MMNRTKRIVRFLELILLTGAFLWLFEEQAMASLESSLIGIKSKLTGVILPVVSVIGLVVATFSFITGNPNAKQHIIYALVGSAMGFGASSIIDFIRFTVY